MFKKFIMLFVLLTATVANAQTFTATDDKVSASVSFEKSGNDLRVRLFNTSKEDEPSRSDLLTSLLFNLSDAPILTLQSAIAPIVGIYDGKIEYSQNVNLDATKNYGAWQLKAIQYLGMSYGLSTVGMGVFNGNLVDGDTYGIYSDSSDIARSSLKKIPLVKNEADFVIAGAGNVSVTDVKFGFGSSPDLVLSGKQAVASVPELDPGLLISSLIILAGCTFIITAKK